jgi:hypothetical protein
MAGWASRDLGGVDRGPRPGAGTRTGPGAWPGSTSPPGTPGKRTLVEGLGLGGGPAIQRKVGHAPHAPDLQGAPYQWVPGTFSLWVSRAWYRAASDFAVSGARWVAPSRIRELLTVLRDHGMLAWAAPERIARAAEQIDIAAGDAPVSLLHLGTSAFDALGLPPGTSALAGKTGDRGLEVVIAVPNVRADEGTVFSLSPPARQQLVAALEAFTQLAMVPAERQKVFDGDLRATLGAGTALVHLNAATGAQLFGTAAYDRWLATPAGPSRGGAFDVAAGNQSFGDLTPDEVTYVQAWLEAHLTGGASGRAVVMSRLLLGALHALDDGPESQRLRVLAMLRGKAPRDAGEHPLSAGLLDRLTQQAKFDEEREAAGFQPDNHGKHGRHERRPVFDRPLPAKIDQRNGLVLSGEDVELTLRIAWPDADTADQQSEYTWRPMTAQVEWLFERTPGRPQDQARQTSQIAWKHDGRTHHRFQLAPGEDTGVWTVHAFVRHNFFQPTHLTTPIEVKTEATRLQELRREAFRPLGQPAIDDADHDFSTSTFNEWFGDHAYDHGLRFRGELPAGFQRRTPGERKATLAHEITTSTAMLAYLRHDGSHSDAVAACEHYLARLRDAASSMDTDVHEGWRPFEVRGTFLGRGNHVADGPLDLYGAVQRQTHTIPGDELSPPTTYDQVHVQIRDLSRRLEAENYRFEGSGDHFEQALEAAFVDLCKKYPGGKLSILAEAIAPDHQAATGKTVGFELDTASEWKDVKARAFDPAVNMAVNLAGAIAAIFAPQIAIPLLLLYNEAQNVDQLVDELDSGTFTLKRGVMHLAQLGLDVMPLAGRAPILRTSKTTFAVFHVTGLAGQALLMTGQVTAQIAQLRDTQVKEMAKLYAQGVELETSTQASDPARAARTAELDRRAEEIRKTALDVWTDAITSFAVVAVPGHLAGALHEQVRLGRVAELERTGRFAHRDHVDPRYDPQRGQIVGDQARMDRPTIDRLRALQDAHLRELGARLAAELGVEPARILLEPGDANQIWKDGDDLQVRYAPGSDPEHALTAWARDARTAKIGKPGHGHGGDSARGDRGGHSHGGDPEHDVRGGHSHGHGDEPDREAHGDHPRSPADHETVSETARVEPELAEGGHSPARETTAAAVPGSEFRGGVCDSDPRAVLAEAHTVFEATARRFGGVQAVEQVMTGTDPARSHFDNTYLLTMEPPTAPTATPGEPAFTIRVTSGPIGSDAVARAVVNPTKLGVSRVARPGPPGAPRAEHHLLVAVEVQGRYVIQLNETMDPANARRAVAHEVGEILAERALSSARQASGPDVLHPGATPAPGAVLSPHDRGRLGEIKILADRVNAGDPYATRELIALVEDLGLRDGPPGAAERRLLLARALDGDPAAIQALARIVRPGAELAPDLQAQLDSVRDSRRRYLDDRAARQAATPPIHDLPDARPAPGQRVSPERAHELALEAAQARARKSAETTHRLRTEAAHLPEGQYPKIKDLQIGGGASLAARDPRALLVDARGRWQADAGDHIAQTANQLRGLKDAGIGDPFQFAAPDERVPMSAVRYWEDSIAAQGPVIDGQVLGIAIDDHGKTVVTILPGDPPPIHVEVEGNVVAATGFPVERTPGTPVGMTPDKALDQIKAALHGLADDPHGDPQQKHQAQAALHDLADLTGLETTPGQRERDLTRLRDTLEHHHLDHAIHTADGKAMQMITAGDQWNRLRTDHPDRFLLGDMANLATMDPTVTDRWVIGGLGGTGISAAEIILTKNPRAHVSMVGDRPPAGLIENNQFVAMLRAHADPPTVQQLKALYGLDIPAGDGRFSLVFGVEIGTPTIDHAGHIRAAGPTVAPDFHPEAYRGADNPIVGDRYITAIGREGQLPPIAAALQDSLEARGGKMTMEPRYDDNRQYIGYRLRAWGAPGTDGVRPELNHMDITGAASRFPPWELFEGRREALKAAQEDFAKASDLDAPPESGNFDGGFVASATQASRYAKDKNTSRSRTTGDAP